MGKYMRKCRGVGGEVAVMEVSQVVGVRTRARTLALSSAAATAAAAAAAERAGSKRRKATGAAQVVQNSYLQLRSRSLVMTSRGTPANSGGARARCPSPTPDRLSRCSSNASSVVASVEDRPPCLRSGDPEVDDELETLPCHFECSRERRETTPSSELRVESGDLESTAGKRTTRRSSTETAAAVVMPPMAEIEEFFAAAERANSENLLLFGAKYNYDVANDVPLDGRYVWLELEP